jgi:hypothetical protein
MLTLPADHPAFALLQSVVLSPVELFRDVRTYVANLEARRDLIAKIHTLAGTLDLAMPGNPGQSLVSHALKESDWFRMVEILDTGVSLPEQVTSEQLEAILMAVWSLQLVPREGTFGVQAARTVFSKIQSCIEAGIPSRHPVRVLARVGELSPAMPVTLWLDLMEECGIDLHGREREGVWRPVHRAFFEERADIIDALTDKGVKLIESDEDGFFLEMIDRLHPRYPQLLQAHADFQASRLDSALPHPANQAKAAIRL